MAYWWITALSGWVFERKLSIKEAESRLIAGNYDQVCDLLAELDEILIEDKSTDIEWIPEMIVRCNNRLKDLG